MSRKNLQKSLSYDDLRGLYYVTTHNGGKRKSKTYPTYSHALAALYPRVSSSSGGNSCSFPGSSATLGQWLDWWLTEDVNPSRAASTAYGYRNIVRCHLLPMLGDVPLADLSPLLPHH